MEHFLISKIFDFLQIVFITFKITCNENICLSALNDLNGSWGLRPQIELNPWFEGLVLDVRDGWNFMVVFFF